MPDHLMEEALIRSWGTKCFFVCGNSFLQDLIQDVRSSTVVPHLHADVYIS